MLAAGVGSRLHPLTDAVPKPLLKLGGTAILEQNLRLLASSGFVDVAINLHHHGEAVQSLVGDGGRFGLNVAYSYEPQLLGTAGGTREAAALLPDTWPLLVVYGDNLLRLDLGRLWSGHGEKGGVGTIALHRVADVRGSGVVSFDGEQRITAFREKPAADTAERGWVNAGVYVLEQPVFDRIAAGAYSDFGYDVFPRLLADGQPLFAHCLSDAERVYPIDTPDRYQQALVAFHHTEGP